MDAAAMIAGLVITAYGFIRLLIAMMNTDSNRR